MIEYYIDKNVKKKLDIMIDRVTRNNPKRDAVLIVEGAEGEGKTNTSIANAYYIKQKTGREIHLFFRLESMVKFAQETEAKIIIWDEPALDALSTDWYKKTNQDLIRLLMVARKKRHFFIFNFTKFYKFSEYIVVDRGLGMIHMYSRHETEPGRFVYIKKKNLERLFLGWKISKKRLYKKFTTFRGNYPNVLEKYFDEMDITVENIMHARYEDYEREKDKAILSVGKEKSETKGDVKLKREFSELKSKIRLLKYPIRTQKELASQLDIHPRTIRGWVLSENGGEEGGFPKEIEGGENPNTD